MSDTTHALEIFEAASREYFAHRRAEAPDVGPLLDSIEYSFFNGGKRFRPQLCYATAEALGVPSEKIHPLCNGCGSDSHLLIDPR
jgi:geranylgeranyl pyrophosphate synthase